MGISLLATDAKVEHHLRQLVLSFRAMAAATTTLGAIYELHLRSDKRLPTRQNLSSLAYTLYVSTLQSTRTSLNYGSYEPIPLAWTCVSLGVVELLLGQHTSALAHFRGAYTVIKQHETTETKPSLRANPKRLKEEKPDERDEISVVFEILDIQKSLFSLEHIPEWSSAPVHYIYSFADVVSARKALSAILRVCFEWAGVHFQLRFFPNNQHRSLLIEQGRHVAALGLWLETFNRNVIREAKCRSLENPEDFTCALTLRAMAIAAMISISTIFEPAQSVFDARSAQFQQIILDGEQAMALRQKAETMAFSSSQSEFSRPTRFTLELGIIQPLFYVASNYRSGTWRRRAIACLLHAGQEGPWIGKREAITAWRLTQYEESWPEDPPPLITSWEKHNWHHSAGVAEALYASEPKSCEDVCEEARIASCNWLQNNVYGLSNSANILWIRCSNLREMLRSLEDYDGPYKSIFTQKHHFSAWLETLQF